MTLSVDSEVGALKRVIVHKPGLELFRLTPANIDGLLFDDVMWAEKARAEHDAFQQKLRSFGVEVFEFGSLLQQAIDAPGAREWLTDRLTTENRFGAALEGPLSRLLDSHDSRQLAGLMIGGLLKREAMPYLEGVDSLLLDYLGPDDFLLSPLPNHLFQRDNSAWIYGGVSVSPMAKPARRRETINSRLIYNFHPLFRDADFQFYYGNDSADHSKATVEGGDIHVLGNRHVMIGMGERTSPQGLEVLAERLFRAGVVDKIIVVELPKTRAFMHLDTAMTQIDRDAFSVYPYLPEVLRSFTLTAAGDSGAYTVVENKELFPVVADALGVNNLRVLRAPVDRLEASREQWDDGNNFLAVKPGVIVGYQRNVTTNKYLADQGIEVVGLDGGELGRGRGGPRCMSCPIDREAVAS